ncbi:hypothetical protein CCICO_03915 [Corynebacterium ciconiae DSM 44920]|uniref:hypothetical protein n=1 Tax=Corynebacterium ciconiae TaxID=227319 RepID=UPI0003A6BC95|nr:hypothetical protein [Corynebacterium ciconiae]WKD60820.1 hypothetical protein CCICO_03915 [Corynebacterium ciconiae DSM 44920]
MAVSEAAEAPSRRRLHVGATARTAMAVFALAVGANVAWAVPWGLLRPAQRVSIGPDGQAWSDAAALAVQFPQYALWVIVSSIVAFVVSIGAYRRSLAARNLWTMAAVVFSASIGALMAFDLGNWLSTVAHPMPAPQDIEPGGSVEIALVLSGRVGVLAAAGIAALSYWVSAWVTESESGEDS